MDKIILYFNDYRSRTKRRIPWSNTYHSNIIKILFTPIFHFVWKCCTEEGTTHRISTACLIYLGKLQITYILHEIKQYKLILHYFLNLHHSIITISTWFLKHLLPPSVVSKSLSLSSTTSQLSSFDNILLLFFKA